MNADEIYEKLTKGKIYRGETKFAFLKLSQYLSVQLSNDQSIDYFWENRFKIPKDIYDQYRLVKRAMANRQHNNNVLLRRR